eukprot:366260-Chlamydomonas_euryale.AAC.30
MQAHGAGNSSQSIFSCQMCKTGDADLSLPLISSTLQQHLTAGRGQAAVTGRLPVRHSACMLA